MTIVIVRLTDRVIAGREIRHDRLCNRAAEDDRPRRLRSLPGAILRGVQKIQGRLLSADDNPAILEGAWDRDRLVLMSFPDEAAFHAWADSPEYLEIADDRKAGAQAVVLLAKGFTP
jgi:uncharacterized protein (DUF1330 family)